jgi:hypothetical protein
VNVILSEAKNPATSNNPALHCSEKRSMVFQATEPQGYLK